MNTPNPDVDAYVRRVKRWQDETTTLRSILRGCGLGEELKWGKPCYTFEGRNLAIIQGFKEHCSVMFFRGSLLKDTHGVLVRPGANSQAGMRIQFTSADQIKKSAPVLRAYVAQAKKLQEAGLEVEFKAKHELALPEELTAKLKRDPALRAAFRALTPGRQRAYVLHFAGAKQSQTRTARIEKCVDRILDGKGLNDR